MDNISFAKNLVKGRIAETIFAQMFRQMGKFTVLEFGYEKIIPELVQNGRYEETDMIKTLRTAPDFAVINREEQMVRLVEVKYRRSMNKDEILETAKRMHASWNPSFLFVATLDGFYFDNINKVIENNGIITPLTDQYVPVEIQNQYLKILVDFESNN